MGVRHAMRESTQAVRQCSASWKDERRVSDRWPKTDGNFVPQPAHCILHPGMMQSGTPEQLLVLLAEDAQAALEHEGLQVAVAHDGLEALELIDKLRPQVVVTDLVMPVLDGLELIRRHAARPAPRAPVIAVSAVAARLRVARELGAAEVLLKPVVPQELLQSVWRAARGQL